VIGYNIDQEGTHKFKIYNERTVSNVPGIKTKKKIKIPKIAYEVTGIFGLDGMGPDYDIRGTFPTSAHSEKQAVLQVVKKLESLERAKGRRIIPLDYKVRLGAPRVPEPSWKRWPGNFFLSDRQIITRFLNDLTFEHYEGSSGLLSLKRTIFQGLRNGFPLIVQEPALEGNWEAVAETISQDPRFAEIPALPLFA
jgi:hypothetical protein